MGPDVAPDVVPGTIHSADEDTVHGLLDADPVLVTATEKLPPLAVAAWEVGESLYELDVWPF
jgi:hypothetical protein